MTGPIVPRTDNDLDLEEKKNIIDEDSIISMAVDDIFNSLFNKVCEEATNDIHRLINTGYFSKFDLYPHRTPESKIDSIRKKRKSVDSSDDDPTEKNNNNNSKTTSKLSDINNNNTVTIIGSNTSNSNNSTKDIWGSTPPKEASLLCMCPECGRNVTASRFASHLEKCIVIHNSLKLRDR